jgi:hypothetical protein
MTSKAFLFVDSKRAGHAAAIYYSLGESRHAHRVNSLTYPDLHPQQRTKQIDHGASAA